MHECRSDRLHRTPFPRRLRRPVIASLGIALAITLQITASPVRAQNPPVDLTELSLEELLSVRIVGEGDGSDASGSRWSVGYRYLRLTFDGYMRGTRDLTFDDVLQEFPVVPTTIRQEAHVIEVGFAATDRLRLLVQAPYIEQETDHIRRVGDPFTIRSHGLGDASLSAVWQLNDEWSASLGVSAPTGSIDETGTTPRGPGTQLPYTMQIGSGTWDLLPGLAFSTQRGTRRLGFQALGTVRLGTNDRDYTLGDRLLIAVWGEARSDRSVRPTVRLVFQDWQQIDGADTVLNPDLAPVANSALSGGEKVLLMAGVAIHRGDQRYALDAGVPIYQSLTGPQPGEDLQLRLSVGFNF